MRGRCLRPAFGLRLPLPRSFVPPAQARKRSSRSCPRDCWGWSETPRAPPSGPRGRRRSTRRASSCARLVAAAHTQRRRGIRLRHCKLRHRSHKHGRRGIPQTRCSRTPDTRRRGCSPRSRCTRHNPPRRCSRTHSCSESRTRTRPPAGQSCGRSCSSGFPGEEGGGAGSSSCCCRAVGLQRVDARILLTCACSSTFLRHVVT